jgi:hypothetical protein
MVLCFAVEHMSSTCEERFVEIEELKTSAHRKWLGALSEESGQRTPDQVWL